MLGKGGRGIRYNDTVSRICYSISIPYVFGAISVSFVLHGELTLLVFSAIVWVQQSIIAVIVAKHHVSCTGRVPAGRVINRIVPTNCHSCYVPVAQDGWR
jgi:hypothetical protein